MDVSVGDAARALNVLFSFTILGAAVAALMTFQCFKATKKSKKSEHTYENAEELKLENRL